MEYRDIGENIRKYRNRLNLTQDELADKIGVTWEMISRYERGQSSPMNQLDKLSNALRVSLGDLISDNKIENYEVPLFVKIPKNFVFKKENTTIYYSCPKWLIKLDPDVFAIELDIVSKNKYKYGDSGYIFISPNADIKDSDLVLINDNKILSIKDSKYDGEKAIGKVMMQEILL
ncbi:MAG: helix-turn-helix transcriptional regulator [Candidatus Dojkabacteria bacterium]|nr:helix-turn-helix transcriptional regulator [Candidatus Dojkabacteria bacterium]